MKGCRLPALAALRIRKKHGVVVALHHDLVLEPDAGYERGAGGVVLDSRLVHAQVPDAVAGLDLVNRARAVLEQAIGLRADAIKVLGSVADRIVVDLDLETRDHRSPCGVARIKSRFVCSAPLQFDSCEVERRTREAHENAAVVFCRIEDLELET